MTPEELAAFREDNRDRLDRMKTGPSADVSASIRSRKKRRDERVMVDGHWYHHEAPHGTASAVQYFGCCCSRCRKWGNDAQKAARRARKDKGGGLDRA